MKLDKHQILKNDRIKLTAMAEANTVFIHTLMTSPDWLEFIGDRKIYSIPDAIEYIKKVQANPAVNFWVITNNMNGTPVGVVTIIKKDYLAYPDIGFALLPAYYREGYAYEASKLILHSYFSSDSNTEILATSLKHNYRSMGLLEKLGFKYKEEILQDGHELNVYSLSRLK
jgi:ribosomal-protein-alanine N-acetyltransferase